MKRRRIRWSCKPASFGYHMLATVDLRGEPLDINVALEKVVWDKAECRAALLQNITKNVNLAIDRIESTLPTLH